ncbi:MAG: Crp/Fnr family transcriptional regulator [Hyphomicrobium sp.]|jgi:CRP-like cAMP-binding protein
MPAKDFENRLLLALPGRELEFLAPHLEKTATPYKEVLADEDSSLDYVYFPNSGVISVVAVYSDGNTSEMATIGREGTTGFQELLGGRASSARLLVQVKGSAMRLKRSSFNRAVKELPTFRTLMYAHLHAFLLQVMLSGACNSAHTVKQRLARWLLMMQDRHNEGPLLVTQELLAEMLGVHRPTVSTAARSLSKDGVIQIKRGCVQIVDRHRLVGSSCECYEIIRTRTAQWLPKTYPA